MPDPARIVICDDHAVVRSGLRRVLAEDPSLEIVQDVGTAAEAVQSCHIHRPQVVVLDVTLPDASGISAIERILEASPHTRILMLTMHEDVAYLRQAFERGAMGYVLKAAADVELLHAVHEVINGVRYVHPALGAALLKPSTADPATPLSDLSDREGETLKYLALGYTNAEMADMMNLSVRTVETYRLRLQQKVGLRSRAELARLARESGLVR